MSARLQVASAGAHLVIDDIHDLARASDSFSRLGAYLAMRLPAVIDDDPDVLTDPVRWAAFAWATATTPVMSPGYVERNDPIEDIQVGWDDGHVAIEAVLRTDPPVNLSGWRGWDPDHRGNHVEPWYSDRTALARLTLRAILVDLRLPWPPRDEHSRNDIVFVAKAAISSVAGAVEEALAPVVAALTHRDQTARMDRVSR